MSLSLATNRELACIMFTDIVSYTRLMGIDEQMALDVLKKNRAIHNKAIKQYGGRWIKELGDGVLITFKSATDAVHCALAIQHAAKDIEIMKLRIGIHLSEVVFENDDVFGEEPAILATSISTKDLLCYEDSTGEIDLTITGGTMPYSVLWNTSDTTEDLTNIGAGSYYVEVTDANSCNVLDTAEILQPDALSGSITKADILCYGDSTGSADLTMMGGSLPYSYKWSNNDTVEDLSNVTAGTYYLEVTDSNSCTWLDTVDIVQPDELILALDSLPEREDESNGKAWVTVTGGVGPYQYEWNDPASSTTDTAFNLRRGVYTVKVTDANGCEKIDSIDIPSVLSTGDLILPGRVMIYPNPTEGQIGIYNLEDMGGDVLLVVTDSRGRIVVNQRIGDAQEYQLTMPGNMVDGTYLISLYGSAVTVRKHFILLR